LLIGFGVLNETHSGGELMGISIILIALAIYSGAFAAGVNNFIT
jgi:hypothetical protein